MAIVDTKIHLNYMKLCDGDTMVMKYTVDYIVDYIIGIRGRYSEILQCMMKYTRNTVKFYNAMTK